MTHTPGSILRQTYVSNLAKTTRSGKREMNNLAAELRAAIPAEREASNALMDAYLTHLLASFKTRTPVDNIHMQGISVTPKDIVYTPTPDTPVSSPRKSMKQKHSKEPFSLADAAYERDEKAHHPTTRSFRDMLRAKKNKPPKGAGISKRKHRTAKTRKGKRAGRKTTKARSTSWF